MEEFDRFILCNNLVDLALQRYCYTWLDGKGIRASRIDRFLITNRWNEKCPNLTQTALECSIGDHRPLILQQTEPNWGPRQFNTLDCWNTHPDFRNFVKETWTSLNPQGTSSTKLHLSIKHIRYALQGWNKEVFGSIERNLKTLQEKLDCFDAICEQRTLMDAEIQQKYNITQELKMAKKRHSSMMCQKAWARWITEGDGNTTFFHASVRHRRYRNTIHGLHINGVWTTNVQEVKDGINSYFANHFNEQAFRRPLILKPCNNTITDDDNTMLTTEFSEDEAFTALWSCSGSKSLGPDGITFSFLQVNWEMVKSTYMNFLLEFYHSGSLFRPLNATSIVLAPKIKSPSELSHYRPISLVSSGYKLLAKILAARMRRIIGKLISPEQLAFIKGRQIQDGILLANESLHHVKQTKKKSVFLKVDFAKAFDSVNWDYMCHMMVKMGFSPKWIKWIRACISSASGSVLINGSPSSIFDFKRGLRQGDPLYSLLFAIASEGLNMMIKIAVDEGKLKGIRIGNKEFTHSLYADDTLFFGLGTSENVLAIKAILRLFKLVSGLRINFQKSSLLCLNIPPQQHTSLAKLLGCSLMTAPFTYLGIKIECNPSFRSSWSQVIETMRTKTHHWTNKFLSFAGKVTMIKSVLSSIPVYYFSMYKAPKIVIKVMVWICSEFLWCSNYTHKNSIVWVKWDDLCKQKEDGGLGLLKLEDFNLALLRKWGWRLLTEQSGNWREIIQSKYLSQVDRNGGWIIPAGSRRFSKWWKELREVVTSPWFLSRINRVIGDGKNTRFWRDNWRKSGPLAAQYPKLYNNVIDKNITPYNMWSHIASSSLQKTSGCNL